MFVSQPFLGNGVKTCHSHLKQLSGALQVCFFFFYPFGLGLVGPAKPPTSLALDPFHTVHQEAIFMFWGLFSEIFLLKILILSGKHQQKLLSLFDFFSPAFPTTTFTPLLFLLMQQCHHFPLSTHFIHILDKKSTKDGFEG